MAQEMNILEKLEGLLVQSGTERSHYYAASCCREAIKYIQYTRDASLGVILTSEPAKHDGYSMIPNHRIKALADSIKPACTRDRSTDAE